MGEVLGNNFFDDDSYVPAQTAANGDRQSPMGNLEDRQRRRRPRQAVANLPSFDDELKEGTQLYNQQNFSAVDHNGQQNAPTGRTKSTDLEKKQKKQFGSKEEPRKIGSQFLELNKGFSLNVSSINEDIVALSKEDLKEASREVEFPTDRGFGDLKSQLADRIYVERKGKFYTLSKRPEEWIETPVSDPTQTNLIGGERGEQSSSENHLSVSLYKASRHLFLFAHGLLSGLALFHCIFVFYKSPLRQSDWLLFAHIYAPMAVIFKTLYQVLVAICCVSCLCRIDLMGGVDPVGGVDFQFLTKNFEIFAKNFDLFICAVLYFGAAALTHLCDVSTMRLLHETNSSTGTFPQDFLDELDRWKMMDAIRTGFVCVGWILVSFRWKRDRMQTNLEKKN